MESDGDTPLIDLDAEAEGTGSSLAFAEGDAATAIAPAALLSNADAAEFDGATLTVSYAAGGTADDGLAILQGDEIVVADGQLRFGGTLIGSVSGGGSGAALILTFNDAATAAAVQALLRSIAYSNGSDNPVAGPRSVKFVLTQASSAPLEASASVEVAAVNDAPALDLDAAVEGTGTTLHYGEGDGVVAVAPAATVADLDSFDLAGGTLIVSFADGGTADDALTLLQGGSGAGAIAVVAGQVSYGGTVLGTVSGGDGGTSLVLVFNAAATPAAVAALVRAIGFSNASDDPVAGQRSVRFEISDGDGGSAAAIAAVTVAPANDAPSIDLNGAAAGTDATLDFNEGDPATAIAPGAVLDDVDSRDFAGGTLTVSFLAGGTAQDALGILAEAGGIEAADGEVSYDGIVIGSVSGGASGADLVFELNAAASAEAVQALVRAVSFSNGSDDPASGPRTVGFALSDGDGGAATATAIVDLAADDIVHLALAADGTDQAAIINAALANSNASIVMLPAGEFMFGTNILVPEGKTLIGAGRDATVLKVLPGFDFHHGNSAIEVIGKAVLADLTLDVNKANLGGGAALRVCGVMGTGEGFLVENVTSRNATGYAFWGNGVDPTTLASGVFRGCFAENSNVLFETTYADGILFEDCIGADGDGDIACEGAFHPVSNSSNITFKDCFYTGTAIAVNVVADIASQKNLVFDNVHGIVTSDALAVIADAHGAFTNEIYFINSSFEAQNTNAAQFSSSRVYGSGTSFESFRIAFALISGTAEMIDSTAIAKADPLYLGGTFGVLAGGAVSWAGGYIAASGIIGSVPAHGNITLASAGTFLLSEFVAGDEGAVTPIDVTANDFNAGRISAIAAIAGTPVVSGGSVRLASGASVTLNANGMLSYDAGGAFGRLAAPASGAVNTAALDQFSYTLANGLAGQARVTVKGVVSPDDVLEGDARANTINGSHHNDLFMLHQGGGDVASGGGGDDRFYFGGELTQLDKVSGGAGGADEVSIQGDYAGGLLLGAAMLDGVERLLLLSASDSRFVERRGGLFSYSLVASDDALSAAALLTVDGAGLGAGERFDFDGSAEKDGRFELRGGHGADTLVGGRGDDRFRYDSAAALAGDRIDGGAGTDALVLGGSFSGTIPHTLISGIESLVFASAGAGRLSSVDVMLGDGMVASGRRFAVDSTELRAGEQARFDGTSELDASFDFTPGAGRDHLIGGARDDVFAYKSLAHLTGDRIDGRGGDDSLSLTGWFMTAFGPTAMAGIERLTLGPAGGAGYHYYNLTFSDGNVAAGRTLVIDASALRVGEPLQFNGQAELDGAFTITGGASNDHVFAGAGNDVLRGGLGGDVLSGGRGDDIFLYGSAAELSGDRIDGGAGFDTMSLSGYVMTSFAAGALVGVERFLLASAEGSGLAYYNLTINDANVAAGQTLLVDGSALRYAESLLFWGQNERDGRFSVIGGASNDYIFGGAGADRIEGGIGADYLRGSGGADVFAYGSAAQSASVHFDRIVGFDAREDRIDLPETVSAWNGTVIAGLLRGASFDADLAAALDPPLGPNGAALFTPDAGDFAGRTFLIVDANGDGLYRAGEDYVIEFVAPAAPLPSTVDIFV